MRKRLAQVAWSKFKFFPVYDPFMLCDAHPALQLERVPRNPYFSAPLSLRKAARIHIKSLFAFLICCSIFNNQFAKRA